MTDIVERLRGWADRFERTTPLHKAMLREAAAEIERLTALLKRHDDLCRWDEAMGVSSTWTPELLALVKDTRAALKDTTP
jgi:hypothetical protein